MSRNGGKRACIFDFDGTLVDSMGAFADLAGRLLQEAFGLTKEEGRERYLRTSGLPFREQLEALFPSDPRNERTALAFEERKRLDYFAQPLFPNTAETLEYLRGRGLKLAVSSSNFPELVEAFLKRKRLALDLVLGWRPGFSKGKAHFDCIQDRLSLAAHQILFVGDSLKDAEKSAAHGIDFVGKAGTFPAGEFRTRFPEFPVIHDLAELKEIL